MFSKTTPNMLFVYLLLTAVILLALFFIFRFIYRKNSEKLLHNLVFKRYFSRDLAAVGDVIDLTEIIYNPSSLPIFKVTAEEYIFNDLELLEYFHDEKLMMQYYPSKYKIIMPHMQIRRTIPVRCLKRGEYKLLSVQLNCSIHKIIADSPATLNVYPRPEKVKLFPFPSGNRDGSSLSLKQLIKDPFSFSGIRDYKTGDPFSLINFKATAKAPVYNLSDIKVNNRDFISDREILILLNFSTPEEPVIPNDIYLEIMENALNASVYILSSALDSGSRCSFYCNCKYENSNSFYYPAYSSRERYIELMKCISKMRIEPGVSFSRITDFCIKKHIYDTEIYLISLYENQSLNKAIKSLERMNNRVNLIIPSENIKKEARLISEYEIDGEEDAL